VTRAPLPIDDVLGDLVAKLRAASSLVLRAEPGAGKTTRVPPALLDAGLADLATPGKATASKRSGQILLLEPRRLAARAAAARIAEERCSRLGEEIGYHVRFDRRATRDTRIVAMTDGVFVRRLQDDPFLDGVSIVVFDEFHERSLYTDLALAMVQRVRAEIRPDLKIVVMSATLDPAPIARYLGDAAVVESAGRQYPVDVHYSRLATRAPLVEQAAAAVRQVADETPGDLLVFLPGVGEIRRLERELAPLAARQDFKLMPLFGDMPLDAQQSVLARSDRRKVILATNVAETSITIDGVTAVIDTGQARVLRHDAALGLNRLELTRISRASADQRAGRAGRTAAGVCHRLWTEREHAGLADRETAEILRVDLAGPVLELLAWGECDPLALPWFEPPPTAAVSQAFALLERLAAIDAAQPTALGRAMARLPVHPRLARLLVEGARLGVGDRAAIAAAILSDRDPFRTPTSTPGAPRRDRAAEHRSDSDLVDRVAALEAFAARDSADDLGLPVDRGAAQNVMRTADQLRRLLDELPGELILQASSTAPRDADEALLRSIAAAFADRLACRREPRSRRALMVGGRGVRLDDASRVAEEALFVCVEVQEQGGSESLVRQASAVRAEWLDPTHTSAQVEVEFDAATEKVTAFKRTRYLDLVIEQAPTVLPKGYDAAELLAREAAARIDIATLLDDDAAQLRERIRSLGAWMPDLNLPALADEDLRALWPQLCAGCVSLAEVRRRPLRTVLEGLLDGSQRAALDRHAPERIEVPSGSRIALAYESGKSPVLAVRIQELFGMRETPRVAGGRIAVLLHLLGPNYRPQQITSDLASFWNNTYPEVRKELRRRYPKHAWPEDPWNAQAERRPQRR
jgi:ATP-dependent helicase HrpB